jgi:hypothetical protein
MTKKQMVKYFRKQIYNARTGVNRADEKRSNVPPNPLSRGIGVVADLARPAVVPDIPERNESFKP